MTGWADQFLSRPEPAKKKAPAVVDPDAMPLLSDRCVCLFSRPADGETLHLKDVETRKRYDAVVESVHMHRRAKEGEIVLLVDGVRQRHALWITQ